MNSSGGPNGMYVVDTSILARLVTDEPGAEVTRRWLTEAKASGRAIRAPSILAYEMGHVVQREHRNAPAEDRAALLQALLAGVILEPPVPGIFEVGAGLTYLDASYVELARRHGATLVTNDGKMAAAAQGHGVKVLRQ
jgi:predicted nucleic acid-binding protein